MRSAILFLILLAVPCFSQAQRDPNHIPLENIDFDDSGTYTKTLGAGITLDLSAGAVTLPDTISIVDDLVLGASGTAGSLTIYPTTASKGSWIFAATDANGGDYDLTFTSGAQTASRALSIPVLTTTGVFALSSQAQSFTGAQTFSSGALSDSLDAATATTLALGASTATAVQIADTGVATTVRGSLGVTEQATFTLGVKTGANNGTPGTGVTAVEYGDGYNHVTVLTLTAVEFTPTIPANAEGAGVIIYTFPAGAYLVNAAHMDITSGVMDTATNAAELGLGSVIATGDVSALNVPGTFEDIITGQAVADVSTFASEKSTIPTGGAALLFEAGGSHVIHLNVAATWNATVATASATGTVTIYWTFLGS